MHLEFFVLDIVSLILIALVALQSLYIWRLQHQMTAQRETILRIETVLKDLYEHQTKSPSHVDHLGGHK